MLEFLRRRRTIITATLAIAGALLLYSLSLRNKQEANLFEKGVMALTAPVMGVVASAGRGVTFIVDSLFSFATAGEENRKLRDSVRSLNARIYENRETVLENERLKKLLELKSTIPGKSIAANVIGEDIAPWYRSIVIDRGSIDGLSEGMPVMATSGVAGRIVKVAPASSRVLLLTDNASSIAATIQRSRARGVLKGKGRGLCSLEFTTRDEDVKVGDTVVTSGVGGVFQKGKVLGEVTMVKKGEYGMFQTIEVRPAVNTFLVEEVLVVVHSIQ